jgi:hypothetical protein
MSAITVSGLGQGTAMSVETAEAPAPAGRPVWPDAPGPYLGDEPTLPPGMQVVGEESNERPLYRRPIFWFAAAGGTALLIGLAASGRRSA